MILHDPQRASKCVVCEHPCPFESLTTRDPESPELIKPWSSNVWIGVVTGEDGMTQILTTCSERCTRLLLENGG